MIGSRCSQTDFGASNRCHKVDPCFADGPVDRVVRTVSFEDLRKTFFHAHTAPGRPGGHIRVDECVHHRLGRCREDLKVACQPALLGLEARAGMVRNSPHKFS